MSYGLALLAAFANGLSNVMQRKANREQPRELSMRFQLFLNLVRHPWWLGGIVTVILSFLLMVTALRFGRLATVEPVIVLELPLTVLLAAKVFKARLHAREWLAIAGMTTGLAGLIVFLGPTGGDGGTATGTAWALASGLTFLAITCIVVLATRATASRRALLLGAGSGMAVGLTAAFMKGMTAGFGGGITGVLEEWQTYAMVVCGLGSMYLVQNALHAGQLVVAQPGITLADPLVAILWGVFVFHEQISGGGYTVLALLSGLVMAAAAVLLTRSRLVLDETEEGATEPKASQAITRRSGGACESETPSPAQSARV
jgi:drug/metabolite transporter (DMT)-like permease